METIEALRGMDIYLMDQLFKGKITKEARILDAGCGAGRNMRFFLGNDFDITGFDPESKVLFRLKEQFPTKADQFSVSTIEGYQDEDGFDYIICNAVLHFAKDHNHFDRMIAALVGLLRADGILFIRMTSAIGINLENSETGVHVLPDGSTRYCVTRRQIDLILGKYGVKLDSAVKTVKVEGLRSMTMMVFRKDEA